MNFHHRPAFVGTEWIAEKTQNKRKYMKFRDAYKNRFLKAADITTPSRLTIASIAQEEVAGEKKIIMRFDEKEQGLVLNKTNAAICAEAFGVEMDDWVGKTVVLRQGRTPFNGKMVPCIRVEPVREPPAKAVAETGEDDINF